MVDFPPHEKRHIIQAIGLVLARQSGLAPNEYKEAVEQGQRVHELLQKGQQGDMMLRREAQRQFDYHTCKLPVAIGQRSDFILMGCLDVTPLTSMATVWEKIQSHKEMKVEIDKASTAVFGAGKAGSFWFCTPRDNRRLCLVSTCKEKGGGGGGEEEQLSGKQIEDANQYERMTDSMYAHVYPVLLVCPAEQEVLRGVEWTGTRMCRQWIPPRKLKQADSSWRLAHKYKIEGFESKKKWAEAESQGLDRQVAALESGKKTNVESESAEGKKWS